MANVNYARLIKEREVRLQAMGLDIAVESAYGMWRIVNKSGDTNISYHLMSGVETSYWLEGAIHVAQSRKGGKSQRKG